MLIRRLIKFVLFLTFLILQFCHFTNTSFVIDNYGYHPYNFVTDESTQINRRKRQSDDELHDNDELPMNATFPPDTEIENDNETTEHTYYNKTVYVGNAELTEKYYVDMVKWINQKNVNGTTKHDHLTSSYRKAAGVKLKFEFPFYGHKLTNLTIATGGFCYVGDQTHSWLAATQYIAPLMANFDTIAENSTIMYGDDGERMIVEWSKVRLKDNRAAGSFTFQVSLLKNGDIYFVYKDIPLSPKNISDMQHPCKLGISDAYLFNHKVSSGSTQSKRIIHEYHRISIDPENVTSNTIVVLTALPTCLSFNNCMDCSRARLNSFHCSWCNPTDVANKAFCSDQTGLNRRRQEWVEGNCADDKNQLYCNSQTNATTQASLTTLKKVFSNVTIGIATNSTTSLPDNQHPESVVPLADNDDLKSNKDSQGTHNDLERHSENSGIAFFTLLIVITVAFCIWLLYAFYNPHTTSGQLLIKYRPSKWQIPSSHVRYSASVHM